ncbi:hypothetical protein GUJ93_ZPchr0010g11214 [Zizania palustris]|uniref:Poly(A) RNA polymerase mitochondrial-like central palm domain-containing protein n=1 Tax=Zizania palustris TaxID=103762 RepID=A0A8J5WBD4_ZIZPA|nr:hypothetical protein GUJ93_ZPchr0010g11214 [Zizania palustris]
MVKVFNRIAEEIFGKKNGFLAVKTFGSFTMDLFTPKSDLDLSVNFNADFDSQFARNDKIYVIRKLAKALHSHQKSWFAVPDLPSNTLALRSFHISQQTCMNKVSNDFLLLGQKDLLPPGTVNEKVLAGFIF